MNHGTAIMGNLGNVNDSSSNMDVHGGYRAMQLPQSSEVNIHVLEVPPQSKEDPLVRVGSHRDDAADKAENPLQFLSSRDKDNISISHGKWQPRS